MNHGPMQNGPILTVRLLGQFGLTLGDKPLDLPSRPAQSLLAWLMLHPGVAHRREHLAGLFWPDTTENSARSNLRHALWRLRRSIPAELIEADKITICLVENNSWWLDVKQLTAPHADSSRPDSLMALLDGCHGELLPGFYEDWIIRERERLASVYDERIAKLLSLLDAEARWNEVVEWAEKWIAYSHTPEPAYRALMTAHASLGNSSAAHTAYQRCIDALERELDVPPSPETEALAKQIRSGVFVPAVTRGQDDKMNATSVPLPSIHPVFPSNLATPVTPLIGRDAELARLSSLLADGSHRLVTVTGPGGMGKSRLALAAGHSALAAFPHGVFLVELAALTRADDIPRVIGDGLGYPFQNDPRPIREQIKEFLRNRTVLLVLDNFEHLLDGAALLVELLENAPGLKLLVTSRERLHLHAETLFRLDGLAYPTTDFRATQGHVYGAVELFLAGVHRQRGDFQPTDANWAAIANICRSVGGLPLGVILAAAWSGSLSVQEIEAELARDSSFLAQEMPDLDPRHRAISRVFEQTWQRLSAEEQGVLAGLSILVGGFDREAAGAIAGATLPILTRLVDRSLVWRIGGGRYDLHELVRQLARQKLVEAGLEEKYRDSHSRWFLGQLAEQETSLKSTEQEIVLVKIEKDRENIRAAWLWAIKTGETALLQQAIEVLGIFYEQPGYCQEGETVFMHTTTQMGNPSTPQEHLLHGWVRAWHGFFLHQVGQPTSANQEMALALTHLAESSLQERETAALHAFVYLHRVGDLMTNRQRTEMRVDVRQALAIYSELNDDWWRVRALLVLGQIDTFNISVRQGLEWFQQAQTMAHRLGYWAGERQAIERMSFATEHLGQTEEGERLAHQALGMIDDPNRKLPILQRLAFVQIATGRFEESAAASHHCIQWAQTVGLGTRQRAFLYNNLARAYLDLGRFAEGKEVALTNVADWKKTYGWEQPFLQRSAAMGVLATGDAPEAFRLMWQTVQSQQQMGNENALALSGAFVDCAYPALALNNHGEACQMLVEGLRLVQLSETHYHTCLSLPAIGVLFATEDRLEDAAFVNGAIQRFPCLTRSRWYAAVALDRLAELLSPLPAHLRAGAEKQGASLDLPKMTEWLLAKLESPA